MPVTGISVWRFDDIKICKHHHNFYSINGNVPVAKWLQIKSIKDSPLQSLRYGLHLGLWDIFSWNMINQDQEHFSGPFKCTWMYFWLESYFARLKKSSGWIIKLRKYYAKHIVTNLTMDYLPN